jgi:hypothetical protein
MVRHRRLALFGAVAFGLVGLTVGLTDCPGPRTFIFPAPPPRPVTPPPGAALIEAPIPGGGKAYALRFPAPAGAPTVVHFHGNAEQLSGQVWLGEELAKRGLGFYAIEYPGYGPAAALGPPTEEGLYAAADAALAHLRDALGVPASDTVLMGWSLGTGVAAEMATRGHGSRLVLCSPYTSIPDMAERATTSAARAIIDDRFDTAAKAPRLAQPTLIIHGTLDRTIPVDMGRRLDELFPESELLELPAAGHNVWRVGGAALLDRLAAFAHGGRRRPEAF